MVLKSRQGIYTTTDDGAGNAGSLYVEATGVTITGTGGGALFNVGSGVASTFGGTVTLNADPTNPLEAATKQYVDTFLPLSGGTLTGFLTLNADPSSALHAA